MTLWVTDSLPLEMRSIISETELQLIIRAVYKQVLGNKHLMDNEYLTSAESLLRQGDITVREFVRAVAKSDLYRTAFFEASSAYQFIEFNCKHLLGRAPQDQTEIARHVLIYNEQGYDAEIDSYLNSEEYLAAFGENVVPYIRGSQTQVGSKNVNFNRTFALTRGYASGDIAKQAQLISDIGGDLPTKIMAPASGSGAYDNTGKRFKISFSTSSMAAAINRFSKQEYVVSYTTMSENIQNIVRRGGKILSITEA